MPTTQQDPTQAAFDQSAQVPDIPASGKEKAFGLLKGLTVGSGTKQEPSALEAAIQKEHAKRLDEARMHKRNAATAAGILTYGIDPKTGQPLTDEDRQRYMNEYQAAIGHYEKAAGVNKETKGAIARARQIVEHMIQRGQQKQQAQAGGGALGPQQAGPPPVPQSGSAPAGPQGSGPPQIPFAEQAPFLRDKVEQSQAVDLKRRLDLAPYEAREEVAKRLWKPDDSEYKEFVATGKLPLAKPPTTLDAAWLRSFYDRGEEPTPEQIEAHYKALREKPLDATIAAGIDAAQKGDTDKAKQLFDIAKQASTAKKGASVTGTSLMAMIDKANSGDQAAQKDVKTYLDMQKSLAMSRGVAFGMGRAMYQIGSYIDGDTQQIIPLSNYDAIQRIKNGQNLVPAGRLPANVALQAQRLVKEATPALKEVRDNLKAYDNAEDRAIFARVMERTGRPGYGQEATWFGNVIDQVGKENLSPEGRKLIVRLGRLNETMGTLRATLGAPATDSSMALMMALLPGPTTPDARMAADMLDQLEANVTNAVELPGLTGVAKPKGGGPPPVPKAGGKKADPLGIL